MSLSGALSSAISALSAQSQSLAMISDNIANSQTNGYKTTTASFEDLVTASSSATTYSSGGVTAQSQANITTQGLLTATSTATNVAIQGNGFFTVTTALNGGTTLYTRNGDFSTDSSGYLTNNGYYLEGWPTDASGNVVGTASTDSLVPINTEIAETSGSATTSTSFALNLPADAPANTSTDPTAPTAGSTFTSSMSVYDSLGTANTVQVTWTKSATPANTWTASFANPTSASDTSTTTGTTSTTPVTVTFNSDGSLQSTSPTPPTLSIGSWTDGAAASTIALNFGNPNGTDGLTQLASGSSTPSIDTTSIQSDGLPFGKLSSVAVGSNGLVNATYSNGQTISIYKIPVTTFAAPDQLEAQTGGMYSATQAAGTAVVQASGTNGAGTVYGSELESSTTDTNQQFSSMISAQQAYSAASQVISAVNKMFDTLIESMR
jgi:flagellar hook protein FlgE